MRKKQRIQLNLQFFAEPNPEPTPNPEPAPSPEPTPEPTPDPEPKEPTVQELMVEMAKLKKAQEKAASEAAEYKRKYQATLSEKEQASLEKAEKEAEREEQFNQLMRENRINKLEKNFVLLGYSEEQANKAATAQYDGDTDTLFRIQDEVQKAKIKEAEAEWLKSRPPVNTGTGNEKEEDAFLKGFKSVGNKFN